MQTLKEDIDRYHRDTSEKIQLFESSHFRNDDILKDYKRETIEKIIQFE
jgi:hypothetical protein